MRRFLAFAFLFPTLAGVAVSQSFSDDFDRADGSIGNGWSHASDNSGGDMMITGFGGSGDGAATNTGAGGNQGIHRTQSIGNSIRVQATITALTGSGGEPNRFESALTVNNTGTLAFVDGYGIYLNRTHGGFSNSKIQLMDNGGVGGTQLNSSFQFSSALEVDFTIFADGTITGTISEGANVFGFTYPAHVINASGTQFAYASNNNSAGSTQGTIDDVVLTVTGLAVPSLSFAGIAALVLTLVVSGGWIVVRRHDRLVGAGRET